MKLNVFASFTIAALISVAQAGPLPQQSASLGDVFAQADSEAQPVKKGILPEEGDDQHGSEVYTRALLAGKNKGGITVTAQVDTAVEDDLDDMGYEDPKKYAEKSYNREVADKAREFATQRKKRNNLAAEPGK